jgi:2-succinyl-6-hydroxy-2,4-cyclohexadiene-1-carboxylate synthase
MTRVVLVHGFTQTRRSWDRVAPALAARHEVVALDLPGHGELGDAALDLWQGARLLAQRGGAAAYAGYSMGGRLCLHLALAHPDLVEALVLLGATAGIEDGEARARRRLEDERRSEQLERDGVEAFVDEWLAQPMFASLSRDAAGVDDRRRNSVAGLAASLRLAGTGAQEPLWHRLGELEMPVLLVTGERDERFRALARRMAKAIGANARLAVVPGAGHAAHLERPDTFAELVAGFLDELPGSNH